MTEYFYSNIKGIAITQILFTIFTAIGLYLAFEPYWLILSILVYYMSGCLGITITFHRYLTHKSFKMPKWCEYLFSFFGAMGGTGSTLGWLSVHRTHHKYTDKDGDPHSPHNAGWKIIFGKYNYKFNPMDAKSMLRYKFHVNLHRYYYLIFVLWGLALFAIDPHLGLYGFIIPVTLQTWISNMTNWANHSTGYTNFKTSDDSRNTWWISALNWGDGWHNNHHARPASYTFQYKWWEIDISAYCIYLICLLSGTTDSMKTAKL